MAVIKASKVEFQVLKQDIPGAAAKYVMTLSYEPEGFKSKEILNIVLADETPYIDIGVETETATRILQRTGPNCGEHHDGPEIRSPEDIYYQEKIKLTPEDREWRTKE